MMNINSAGFPPYFLLAVFGVFLGAALSGTARLFGCRARPKTRLVMTALFFAAAIPALYRWEVARDLPLMFSGGSGFFRFAAHVFLLAVAALVSLIDFEQYVIPDLVTIPATILAVLLMTLLPGAAMPDYDVDPCTGAVFPKVLTAFADVDKDSFRLTVSAAAVLFWVFAMSDRRWYRRLGLRRRSALFFRRLRQSRLTWFLFGLAAAALAALWWFYHTPAGMYELQKRALLSALVGAAASMTLIWGVRLIGGWVMGREAMGFGDVVLMGFLGAVFGWQGGMVLFFLAPLAGVVFGLVRLASRSPREIPYGPFLCLAALAVIFGWEAILPRIHDFLIGPLVAAILLAMGVLMALLLWVIQIVKRCFR